MNRKHQWNGTFEKVDFLDDLANDRMNTRIRAQDNLSFYVDFRTFLNKLYTLQKQTVALLMKGFKLKEICKILSKSYHIVKQIINSVKEAYLQYFEVELQLAK